MTHKSWLHHWSWSWSETKAYEATLVICHQCLTLVYKVSAVSVHIKLRSYREVSDYSSDHINSVIWYDVLHQTAAIWIWEIRLAHLAFSPSLWSLSARAPLIWLILLFSQIGRKTEVMKRQQRWCPAVADPVSLALLQATKTRNTCWTTANYTEGI